MRHRKPGTRFGAMLLASLALALCGGAGVIGAVHAAASAGNITGRVFLDENADTYFKECDCDCSLEDIPIRLYRDRCAGLIVQTVKTDKEGHFHFLRLEPGRYCVMPHVDMMCTGFQATTPITQEVDVKAGETVEAPWFGFDHYLDTNE
ncbi:MAG: SdrD B-like domain-containing protein [Lysobacterales bacterium]